MDATSRFAHDTRYPENRPGPSGGCFKRRSATALFINSPHSTVLSSIELDELCNPERTRSNNAWVIHVFETWALAKNKHCGGEALPVDMLEVSYSLEIQDKTLSAFVLEVQLADGKFYPGSTRKNIIAALLRVMKQNQGAAKFC